MATLDIPKPEQETQPAAPTKKTAEEAVQALEQRLAALGGPSPPTQVTTIDQSLDMLGFAKPAPPVAQAQVGGGKNDLLSRIRAAQNKVKETSPSPSFDLLGSPHPIIQHPANSQTTAFSSFDDGLLMGATDAAQQAPSVSTPVFGDLLGALESSPAPSPQPTVEEEVIMGLEGLSDEERRALLEEQRQIMEQIEREKNANASAIASAQADNFDMRSTSNAVNAIGGRISIIRSERRIVGGDQAVSVEDLQMEEDRKLAESLQNEEYEQAERPRRQARPQPQAAQQQEESWWDTVTNIFSGETRTEPQPSPAERQSLSGAGGGTRGGGRPAARVAQSQPLFSCVVDSVNSTVGALTGTQLGRDAEGNVHGVDTSSLLNAGGDTEYSRIDND